MPSLKASSRACVDGPMRAHPVAAQPTGRRQFEHPREAAVVGEEQQALGVDVEPADRDDARQVRRQGVENGRPPLGIAGGGDEAAGLVEQEEPGALGRGEPLAVDPDVVLVGHVVGGALEHLAVDGDAALGDPGLRLAARAQARARHHLGDAAAFADLRLGFGFVAHASFRSVGAALPDCPERPPVLSPKAPGRHMKKRGACAREQRIEVSEAAADAAWTR